MENYSDNGRTATTSGTPSSAANNNNTATTSRTASAANFATTLRTASSAAINNDNTATTSRTASNTASTSRTASYTATASRTASKTRSCAACTYHRRKCTADCILAPYFPQHRQKQFANAHRLFGVSRIISMIKDLDPISRDDAMTSIQYEADAQARDPVGGCYRIIQTLRSQIAQREHELNVIRQELEFYRAQFFSVQMMMAQPQQYHPGFQYQIPPLMLQDDQEDENKEPK